GRGGGGGGGGAQAEAGDGQARIRTPAQEPPHDGCAAVGLAKPRLVDPSSWAGGLAISRLEDLCCELRRWENMADKEKGRLRTTGDRAARAQLRRQDRLLSLPDGPESQSITREGVNDAPGRQNAKTSTVFGYKRPRMITGRVDPIAVDVELLDAAVELDEAFLMISNANNGAVLVDCIAAKLSSTAQMVKRQIREELSMSKCRGITWEGINDAPSRQNVKISTGKLGRDDPAATS
ncbi:unnamed protein product, partial [Prorocentrum cordatum]